MGYVSGDWIELVQDRVQCQVFVNMVMNLEVPWKHGISWMAQWL